MTFMTLSIYAIFILQYIDGLNIVQSDKNEKKDINSVTQALDEDIFGDVDKNQYNKNFKEKKYVHIFPHSHTDLGWLSSIEDYFEGKNLEFYIGSVNSTLTTVVQELIKNPKRTFTYAEMEFFKMWWTSQNHNTKNQVRNLIKNGQLNIVNGGMSAPDEATINSDDIIDNFMRGHQFLVNEVGVEEPSISWQLDSFGVSKGYARLAKDIGFEAMFFSRLDMIEKSKLFNEKKKIQMWRADEENFGDKKDILSVTITQEQGNYCWPKGFAFDQNYHEFIDFNKSNSKYNADKKMEHLSKLVNKMIQYEQTDHIFITYGCDFAFTEAEYNYFMMDEVIDFWNQHNPNIQMFYSTPKRYIDEIKKISRNNQENALVQKRKPQELFPLRKDDGFPYEMTKDKYWSGFYTTRPHYKSLLRQTSARFHSSLYTSALLSLIHKKDKDQNSIVNIQQSILEKLGTAHHHDAITGTSNREVAENYYIRVVDALKQINQLNLKTFDELIGKKYGISVKSFDSNIRLKSILQKKLYSPYQMKNQFLFIAQNPSNERRSQIIDINVPYDQFEIQQVDYKNQISKKIEYDNFRFYKQMNLPNSLFTIKNKVQFPVNFNQNETYKVYLIKKSRSQQSDFKNLNQKIDQSLTNVDKSQSKLQNFQKLNIGQKVQHGEKSIKFQGFIDKKIRLNKKNLPLTKDIKEYYTETYCKFKYTDQKNKISQQFLISPRFYQSQETQGDGDGLYEFRPKENRSFQYSQIKNVQFKQGKYSGQILLTYSDEKIENELQLNQSDIWPGKLSILMEISDLNDFIKYKVDLNEIPITDRKAIGTEDIVNFTLQDSGKDVVINWDFLDGFDTNGSLWYDANGLQMVHKQLWKRNEFTQSNTENLASNFYPIQSAIAIKDKNSNKQISIMTDRVHSGSAGFRKNRNIELMINRRINGWDAYGIGQSLNDVDSNMKGIEVKATYYMQIFQTNQQSQQRQIQKMMELPIVKLFSKDFQFLRKIEETSDLKQKDQKIQNEKLVSPLKTLIYQIKKDQILLRVSNMMDNFDNYNHSEKFQNSNTLSFDVLGYAEQLYQQSNEAQNQRKIQLQIEETTLTGQSNYKEREKSVNQWKTFSLTKQRENLFDDQISYNQHGKLNHFQVFLEPQRIRAFTIKFNAE